MLVCPLVFLASVCALSRLSHFKALAIPLLSIVAAFAESISEEDTHEPQEHDVFHPGRNSRNDCNTMTNVPLVYAQYRLAQTPTRSKHLTAPSNIVHQFTSSCAVWLRVGCSNKQACAFMDVKKGDFENLFFRGGLGLRLIAAG